MIDGLIVTKKQWEAKCTEATRLREALAKYADEDNWKALQGAFDSDDKVLFQTHGHGFEDAAAALAPDDGWLARKIAEAVKSALAHQVNLHAEPSSTIYALQNLVESCRAGGKIMADELAALRQERDALRAERDGLAQEIARLRGVTHDA